MKRAVAVLAAAAALFLAGCSAGKSPQHDATPQGSPGRTGTARPEEKKVSGMRGFTLPAWNRDDYQSPQAGTYLRQIAATGARWVTFTPTWYQDKLTDSGMHTTEETAGDDSLRHIVSLAHSAGLKVMIKPHVDLVKGQDRAEIRPDDPDAWFTAYTGFITHYAQLAGENGVEQFAVGTELAGVSKDLDHWRSVITAVRAHYRGTLTYAANYDEYRKVPFWPELDLIGVDAYWPLGDKATTDVGQLREAWQPIAGELAAFSARQQRKILFTEAGYVSQRGATTEPYSWTVSKRNGDAEQAAAYEALLATFDGKPWWAGVCWWMWDDWPDAGETPRKLAYTPHGKPAEQVLRNWWAPR
ncbi:glycoside hydrolase family 113 [Streptomyces sp. NPDC052396]|uniref:glycoside hydrolase family 113 n=1 Tax=Streptomyces sp. NPDC052396 TaxID=3365689 RepID=UPI0037CF4604